MPKPATEDAQSVGTMAPRAAPWIWLCLGGFGLAAAAEKTSLTQWLARLVFGRIGSWPRWLPLGSMGMRSMLTTWPR